MASLPFYISATAKSIGPRPDFLGRPRRIVTTGIGSSEAHARSLAGLLNRHGGPPTHFAPLVSFLGHHSFPRAHLVVFSQGLSSNIQLALARRYEFTGLTLFTSASETGLREAGQIRRAEVLAQLKEEGVEIVTFPLENEYEILIRVVGPACGFLAARQWVCGLLEDKIPSVDPNEALDVWNQGSSPAIVAQFSEIQDRLKDGFVLLASTALDGAVNLICKFIEGVFFPAPHVTDILSFAHGPFQQLAALPRPVVILASNSQSEMDLADRAKSMANAIGAPVIDVRLQACPTLAAFEAEACLNPVILHLSEILRINQREWPGKCMDSPLYSYPYQT